MGFETSSVSILLFLLIVVQSLLKRNDALYEKNIDGSIRRLWLE